MPPNNPTPQSQQTNQQPPLQPQATQPASGPSVGLSASQQGYNQPEKKKVNIKKILSRLAIIFVLLLITFAVLIFTNVIALSEFKTVNYTNSDGTDYKLTFYTKHSTNKLRSGNKQLVSKVSKDNKYPLALSIANAEDSGYNKIKDCSGYKKLYEIQNDNLAQKISVCEIGPGGSEPGGVYVAGILYKDEASIVTIAQDLSGVDLSSQSGAQESLPKFGLDPYEEDIKTIVSSISIE